MQKIRIDFDNPGLPQHISAVENDSQSRFFQATLYENGKAYTAPAGASYSIMYRGFGPQNQGWYDTINDGAGKRAACAVSGNVVTCEIARQALQVPGHVSIVLCVTTGKGYMLKSWPIECDCKNDRYDSTAEIQSFFYITQVSNADWNRAIQALEDLKNTIDPTLSLSGKAADAAKVGETINAESERAKGVEKQLKEDIIAPYANTEPSGSAFDTGGNMEPNNRIKSNKLRVFKGDRVKCTDYVNYKFYVNEFDKSGSNLLYGGDWMQSDHVIKNSGQCVIYIAKKNDASFDNVSEFDGKIILIRNDAATQLDDGIAQLDDSTAQLDDSKNLELMFTDRAVPICANNGFTVKIDAIESSGIRIFSVTSKNAISFSYLKIIEMLGSNYASYDTDTKVFKLTLEQPSYADKLNALGYDVANQKFVLFNNIAQKRPSNVVTLYWIYDANYGGYIANYQLWKESSSIKDSIAQLDDSTTKELNNISQQAKHTLDSSQETLTILHFADIHADSAAFERILKQADGLYDDAICAGDIVSNTSNESIEWWNEKVLTCIGNHDCASYSADSGYNWTALTMVERSAKYIEPFKENWNVVHTKGTSYYYKDYEKVRLIVMDTMLYMGANTRNEANTQTEWLKKLLETAINLDLHVVIVEHAVHGGASPVACSFSRYEATTMPTYQDCDLPDVVVNTVATYINNGLHFIGYLCGHTHQDTIWDANGDKTQLMYCITCANTSYAPQWQGSDQHRGIGFDAFNIVTIDTSRNLIKIIRGGGADIDDHMRSRKAICIDYAKGKIVGEIL